MRRYLVVANRTLGGGHLLAKVRECLAAGPSEFHVLVPASHAGTGLAGQPSAAGSKGSTKATAPRLPRSRMTASISM